MRIGILTFHRAINYGAVMQAYALRMYLAEKGHTVFIIDYIPEFLEREYSFFKKPRKNVFININRYLLPIPFSRFLKKKLNLYKFRSDENLEKDFDCLICGSDQIWNHIITNGTSWKYYLKDIRCSKKISYAASMSDVPLMLTDSKGILRCLQDFNYISVRENFAAEYLKGTFNIDSKVVLDPVFLYDFKDIRYVGAKQDYILVFSFQKNDRLSEYIREFKSKLSITVVAIGVPYQREADTNKVCVTPEEWLGWIKHARLILTDSFHCISFALKFQKDFLYIKRADKNNRILDLLKLLDIKSNVLDSAGIRDASGFVNYSTVTPRLETLVNKSKLFLDIALNE